MHRNTKGPEAWPELTTPGWTESCTALHLFTQVVGKTRLALAPAVNHWWQVPLYVSPRGLSTTAIPLGNRTFDVELDLHSSELVLRSSEGARDSFPLDAPTIAAFHDRYFRGLHQLGVEVEITPLAVEIPETILLDRDQTVRRYDPDWGRRLLGALTPLRNLFEEFRGEFIGKASPVHFFWGGFDLAVTRFSGRRAPRHPGGMPHCGDFVTQEAYSHEVSSAGFWPGDATHPQPILYSYAYPSPPGFPSARVLPREANFDTDLGEFVLPYERVRVASSPELLVRQFLRSTYLAAAELGGWPRREVERPSTAARPRPEEHHGVPL